MSRFKQQRHVGGLPVCSSDCTAFLRRVRVTVIGFILNYLFKFEMEKQLWQRINVYLTHKSHITTVTLFRMAGSFEVSSSLASAAMHCFARSSF